ncbi:MAG: PqqD family protein [Flavobacteriales bacterium]|nr:PqqD family protein [Flavobacteriales bacterium]
MDIQKLRASKNELAVRVVGEETVLVPLKGNVADLNEMFTLNEVGSFIWESLDTCNTTEEVVASVVAEFDIDDETATSDVLQFLNNLSEYLIND